MPIYLKSRVSLLSNVSKRHYAIILVDYYIPGSEGGVVILPYLGYIGICGPKGCGFSPILALLGIHREWLVALRFELAFRNNV